MVYRNNRCQAVSWIASGLFFISGCEFAEKFEYLPSGATLDAHIAIVEESSDPTMHGDINDCDSYLRQNHFCTKKMQRRFALIGIQAWYPETAIGIQTPLIEAKVDIGWLRSVEEGCEVQEGTLPSRKRSLNLDSLRAGIFKWCFGDDGGLGRVELSSGSVAQSFAMEVPVPAIPYAIYLSSQQDQIIKNEGVELTATVLGCNALPIPDISVSTKMIEKITITPADGSRIATTDENGSVRLIATVAKDYPDASADIIVHPSSISWMGCKKTLTITQ